MIGAMARTLWLVGMMGAGKSAVGSRLAQRLGRAFIDTDALVEEVAGKSVAAIFADEGEPSFRALERAAIERAAGRPAVVALGGGAIAQPGAVARLEASGKIVYLRARPETLLARVGEASGRPLLAGLDTAGRLARVRELLRAREAHYARAACIVDVDDGDADAVTDRVLQALGGAAEEQGRTMRTVQVPLGDRSYAIRIGVDILDRAGAAIAASSGARRAVVVTVPEVGRRYGARLERSLRAAGIQTRRAVVPDGERSKSLRVVARLYEELLDFGADRGTAVVALGGGVVGDLAGFLAATFLRGVPFVQVPTTMLAMADASIGGKVGVDLPRGKNLVGAFHQPRLVWMDVATLRSLPRRQRANGLVEVIKHGVIRDAALFERFERDIEQMLDLEAGSHARRPRALVRDQGGSRRAGRARGRPAHDPELRSHAGPRDRDPARATASCCTARRWRSEWSSRRAARRRSVSPPPGSPTASKPCCSGPDSRPSRPIFRAGLISTRCVSIRSARTSTSASSRCANSGKVEIVALRPAEILPRAGRGARRR